MLSTSIAFFVLMAYFMPLSLSMRFSQRFVSAIATRRLTSQRCQSQNRSSLACFSSISKKNSIGDWLQYQRYSPSRNFRHEVPRLCWKKSPISYLGWASIRGGGCENPFRSHSSLGAVEIKDGSCSSSSSNDSIKDISFSLPPSFEHREQDVKVALLAVLAASRVTRLLQPTGKRNDNKGDNPNVGSSNESGGIPTIAKKDASPVTIGDFASQALALQILHNYFPNDIYVAEEGSEALESDRHLLNRVREAANQSWCWDRSNGYFPMSEGQSGQRGKTDSSSVWNTDVDLLRAIDYGQNVEAQSQKYEEGSTSKRRVWCLDPIDGTKGFLRGRIEGGQYCIALALIEDGVPVLSVLGCPNFPLTSSKTTPYGVWSDEEIQKEEQNSISFSETRGCLFVAVRGSGCYEIPIYVLQNFLSDIHSTADESSKEKLWKNLQVTANDGKSKSPTEATFCLGVERGFSDPKGTVLKIAQQIHGANALLHVDGIPDIKNSFRLDGQGKYGLLARGDAEYFLRLPKAGYVDWVWDVAAGYVVLTEAGGTMTDVHGKDIDFAGIGVDGRAKLPDNVEGLLGSCGGVFHDELVKAFASAEE